MCSREREHCTMTTLLTTACAWLFGYAVLFLILVAAVASSAVATGGARSFCADIWIPVTSLRLAGLPGPLPMASAAAMDRRAHMVASPHRRSVPGPHSGGS